MTKMKKESIIVMLCIIALCMVTLPLLILSFYSFPIADDWNLGAHVYHCIKNGGNVFDILYKTIETVVLCRVDEPRFMAVFLGALHPGVWSEKAYWLTAWLAIGGVIVSEFSLAAFFLKSDKGNIIFKITPIVVPTLVFQLFYVPFPTETFYWWTGAINYTFIFSISLILFILFEMLKKPCKNKKAVAVRMAVGVILAVAVGGNNYATSLSMACVFFSFSVFMAIKDRKALYRTLPITLTTILCLVICLAAPGNQTRLAEEFDGTTTGAVNAVLMSLVRTATNIYSWTSPGIFIMLFLIAPFLWRALKDVKYTFRYPLLFTAYTFGIYASQIVATMYVGANTGGGRMADILYYAYHVWLLLNVGYWMGWLQKKYSVLPRIFELIKMLSSRISVFAWFLLAGTLLILWMSLGVKGSPTYRACVWLVKGQATAYAQAWEERLEILHDDSVKEVYFTPLPGHSEMIYYTDFQVGESWINSACARYYNKDYVGLAEEP